MQYPSPEHEEVKSQRHRLFATTTQPVPIHCRNGPLSAHHQHGLALEEDEEEEEYEGQQGWTRRQRHSRYGTSS